MNNDQLREQIESVVDENWSDWEIFAAGLVDQLLDLFEKSQPYVKALEKENEFLRSYPERLTTAQVNLVELVEELDELKKSQPKLKRVGLVNEKREEFVPSGNMNKQWKPVYIIKDEQ